MPIAGTASFARLWVDTLNRATANLFTHKHPAAQHCQRASVSVDSPRSLSSSMCAAASAAAERCANTTTTTAASACERASTFPRDACRFTARVYADACHAKPRTYWDWERSSVRWWDAGDFMVQEADALGRGKYSNVYGVVRRSDNKRFAIKQLRPVKSRKYKREILILQHLKSGPNIIEFYGAYLDPKSLEPALVFERVDNDNWKELYPTLSLADIRYYSYQLLLALDFVHSKGIIHRDLKPHNVIINHAKRTLRLIDFGLAEFYHPLSDYNLRVASRYYKPPEILLGYRKYDYSFDMWSFGCMLAGMIFRIEVLFRGTDDLDQLRTIAHHLGGPDLRSYIARYAMHLDPSVSRVVGEVEYDRQPFAEMVGWENGRVACGEGIEVVERVLRYDHGERLTAREAMGCAFYDSVRQQSDT